MGISDKWAGKDRSYLELLGKSKAKFIDSPHGAHYEAEWSIFVFLKQTLNFHILYHYKLL